MTLLRIVVDENIPAAMAAFGQLGEVVLRSGRQLTRADLVAADVLVVRSVTPVNADLLAGTPVRFVGSATIGTDHVDLEFLHRANIQFANAPGCNANSVGDYVIAALLEFAVQRGESLLGKRIGIVGAGNTGRAVAKRSAALGMAVMLCDPPMVEAGLLPAATQFDQILQCDIVSLHVPLVRDGQYPTYHLIDQAQLDQLPEGAMLVNACRGEVVNNVALAATMARRADLAVALDVWENEPNIAPSLAMQVGLATPHIAGYSLDGKLAGTRQIFAALQHWLGEATAQSVGAGLELEPLQLDLAGLSLYPDAAGAKPAGPTPEAQALTILRQVYDINADDRTLRASLAGTTAERGVAFDWLRKHYPVRREFSAVEVRSVPTSLTSQARTILDSLGVSFI